MKYILKIKSNLLEEDGTVKGWRKKALFFHPEENCVMIGVRKEDATLKDVLSAYNLRCIDRGPELAYPERNFMKTYPALENLEKTMASLVDEDGCYEINLPVDEQAYEEYQEKFHRKLANKVLAEMGLRAYRS